MNPFEAELAAARFQISGYKEDMATLLAEKKKLEQQVKHLSSKLPIASNTNLQYHQQENDILVWHEVIDNLGQKLDKERHKNHQQNDEKVRFTEQLDKNQATIKQQNDEIKKLQRGEMWFTELQQHELQFTEQLEIQRATIKQQDDEIKELQFQAQSCVFQSVSSEQQKVQDHEIRLDIGNVGDLYSVGWLMDIGAAFNPQLDPQLDCAVVDAHRVALIDCARHHRLVPLLLGGAP